VVSKRPFVNAIRQGVPPSGGVTAVVNTSRASANLIEAVEGPYVCGHPG